MSGEVAGHHLLAVVKEYTWRALCYFSFVIAIAVTCRRRVP
jgi:hypothetical protein